MDQDKVDLFVITNSKYFAGEKIPLLKDRLLEMDNSKMALISSAEYKEPTTMLLVSIFLGTLGIDRFMLGSVGMGLLKLLTFGFCGILTIYDWFTVTNRVRDYNFKKFMELV